MFEMLKKAKALFNVYRAGQAVADPVFLKQGQLSANIITTLLATSVVALKAFNVDIPIDNESLTHIGTSLFIIAGLFNAHATVASTDKIGILPSKPVEQPVANDTGVLTPPNIPDAVSEKPLQPISVPDYTAPVFIPEANV